MGGGGGGLCLAALLGNRTQRKETYIRKNIRRFPKGRVRTGSKKTIYKDVKTIYKDLKIPTPN